MRVTQFFAAAVGLISTVSAFNGTESDLETRASCGGGVHIIALGGGGTTNGDLGYLATLAYGIHDSIKGSTLHQIGYPPGADGATARAYAEPALRKHIRNYSSRCPNRKIVTVGYSIGAAIVMNVLCGSSSTGENDLPDRYKKNFLANVVYGDLTFVPGPKYHVGTCSLPGKVPRQKPGKCFPFGRKTQSYCDANDVECCSGSDPNVHFSYPDKYDQRAIGWVVNRWNRYKDRN